MSSEHATHDSHGGDGEGFHMVHELSYWPLAIGISVLVLYFGIVYRGALTILGLLMFLGSISGWYYEDHKRAQRPLVVEPWNARGRHIIFYGMVFFLCTEVMLFGGLFATYFAGRSHWEPTRPDLPVLKTGIATLILVASSFTYHFAEIGLRKNNRKSLVGWLLVTLALGATFLGMQLLEYKSLIDEGFSLQHGMYMNTFFMLTGTHGLHVLTGLTMIGIITIRVAVGDFTQEHIAPTAVGIYWHFVDVVWIILYSIIYLKVI